MNGSTGRRLRQFASATLGTVMIPVGGAALGYSAAASAQPSGSSWVIRRYSPAGQNLHQPARRQPNPGLPLDDLPVVGKLPVLGGVL